MSMYKRKIAVIVTVYNIENYIKECIDSIINQKFSNIEIILVDDGSLDASGRICDEYHKKDARVKVIHQKNMGTLMARYNGLLSTDCEYVTFVDGDDWLDLNAYKAVAGWLEKGVDVIAFGSRLYYSEDNTAKEVSFIPQGKYLEKEIKEYVMPNMIWNIQEKQYGLYPAIWSKVVKRELLLHSLEKAKNLDIYYGEDIAVVYPMLKEAKSMVISEECLYYHRQRDAGTLPQYFADDKFMIKLFRLYLFLMEEFSGYEECQKQIDYFYIYAVNYRKRIYGDYSDNNKYIFPFGKVTKNCRIILYGAGSVGQTYYGQLKRADYCSVVAWVDKNYQKYQRAGLISVNDLNVINKLKFDYIVIAVLSFQLFEKIKGELILLGIEEEKIVWGR